MRKRWVNFGIDDLGYFLIKANSFLVQKTKAYN